MEPAIAEEKTCLHCPRKLRKDNRRGICTDCAKAGRVDLNGRTTRDLDNENYRRRHGSAAKVVAFAKGGVKPPPKRSEMSALERFRVVAEALGHDPDALLEEFADSYLESLRKAAE